MKKVLILGANGQIARLVISRLLQETDVHLTLYLRKSARLQSLAGERVDVLEGDVNDFAALTKAMKGQDIVYANLGGKFEPMAANIVKAMEENQVSRSIYLSNNDFAKVGELTEKVEFYKGTIISRVSIADLIVRIIKEPSLHSYASLGISKPRTDGDRPMY